MKKHILVNQTGRACLMGFGYSTFLSDDTGLTFQDPPPEGGMIRWMSPELLSPRRFGLPKFLRTKSSDCYALGMVVYEVLRGLIPFYSHSTPVIVVKISEGERPRRPGPEIGEYYWFTDGIWSILEHCWAPMASDRPTAEDVLRCVEEAASSWPSPSFPHLVLPRPQQNGDVYRKVPTLLVSDVLVGPRADVGDPDESDGWEDEGGTTQLSANSQTTEQDPTPSENGPPGDGQGDQLGGRSLNESVSPREEDNSPLLGDEDIGFPVPTLSPVPTNWFSQFTADILDLTDQVASVAIFGPFGIGKSFVARAVLDDRRTKATFGENRYCVRCNDLPNSLEGFIEHLSKAIHTDVAQVRSRLRSSPPLILVLDGVDSILDKLIPSTEEIYATIEEFGSYEHVCLVATSRMYPDIHGFHRIEVPIPPENGACDIFYGLCGLGRSPVMDSLIAMLDFHPFSIVLLANAILENNWDEQALVKVWETGALKTAYYQGLKDAVEAVFRSPTIKELGMTARDVLCAIAAYPSGVEESRLEGICHQTTGIGRVVDVLCKFSLIHRQNGVVGMLSPLRLYFLESMFVPTQAEVIKWGPDCMPAKACMLLYNLFGGVQPNSLLKGSLSIPLDPPRDSLLAPPLAMLPTTCLCNHVGLFHLIYFVAMV